MFATWSTCLLMHISYQLILGRIFWMQTRYQFYGTFSNHLILNRDRNEQITVQNQLLSSQILKSLHKYNLVDFGEGLEEFNPLNLCLINTVYLYKLKKV